MIRNRDDLIYDINAGRIVEVIKETIKQNYFKRTTNFENLPDRSKYVTFIHCNLYTPLDGSDATSVLTYEMIPYDNRKVSIITDLDINNKALLRLFRITDEDIFKEYLDDCKQRTYCNYQYSLINPFFSDIEFATKANDHIFEKIFPKAYESFIEKGFESDLQMRITGNEFGYTYRDAFINENVISDEYLEIGYTKEMNRVYNLV